MYCIALAGSRYGRRPNPTQNPSPNAITLTSTGLGTYEVLKCVSSKYAELSFVANETSTPSVYPDSSPYRDTVQMIVF